MQEKYGYSGRTNDMSATEAPTKQSLPAIRREFEGICKLIEVIYDRYGVLVDKISPVLYTGPSPEGDGASKSEPEPTVSFAAELAKQRTRLLELNDRINDTIKRVEI